MEPIARIFSGRAPRANGRARKGDEARKGDAEARKGDAAECRCVKQELLVFKVTISNTLPLHGKTPFESKQISIY
jgi:hypothetical protein